jgi:hypothetical protein
MAIGKAKANDNVVTVALIGRCRPGRLRNSCVLQEDTKIKYVSRTFSPIDIDTALKQFD